MKITLCGSIAFYNQMLEKKSELEKLGYEVNLPPAEWPGEHGEMVSTKDFYTIRHQATKNDTWVWDRKKGAILSHFNKVAWADAILVLNYNKNNILGYIGANTLMEMGIALYLNKPIYLLNPIPEMPYSEEIRGMKPIMWQ